MKCYVCNKRKALMWIPETEYYFCKKCLKKNFNVGDSFSFFDIAIPVAITIVIIIYFCK